MELVACETKDRVPILTGAAKPTVNLLLEACARHANLGRTEQTHSDEANTTVA